MGIAIIIPTLIIARQQKRKLRHQPNLSKPRANRKARAQLMLVMGTATGVGTMCRDVASAWTIVDGLETLALEEIPRKKQLMDLLGGVADWQATQRHTQRKVRSRLGHCLNVVARVPRPQRPQLPTS